MNTQIRFGSHRAAAAAVFSAGLVSAGMVLLPGIAKAEAPDRQELLNTLDDMAAATGEIAPIRAAEPVAVAQVEPVAVAPTEGPAAAEGTGAADGTAAAEVQVVGAVEVSPAPVVPHLAGAPAEAALPAPSRDDRRAEPERVRGAGATTPTQTRSAAEDAATGDKKAAGTPLTALKDREIEASGRVGWLAVGMALALLAAVATWLKRRTAKNTTVAGLHIETISTTRLGGKHAVSLIKVGGRVLVVGQGEKGLTLLTELDDEDSAPTSNSGAPRMQVAGSALGLAANTNSNSVETGAGSFVEKVTRLRAGWKDPAAGKAAAGKNGIRFPTDPFHAAMLDDAPVDELQRLDERAQIRERLEQLRRRSVAVA